MAQLINGPNLFVNPNPSNLNLLDLTIAFTVRFSPFDRTTGLNYTECIRIFGVDKSPEDGADDVLVFGVATIAPPSFGTDVFRNVKITATRAELDEDQPPVPNPDELQAQVTLTPHLPVEFAKSGSVVPVNLP